MQSSNQVSQTVPVHRVVGVKDEAVLPAGEIQGRVARSWQTAVYRMTQEQKSDLRMSSSPFHDRVGRAVGGAIVDHDDLKVHVVQCDQGVERLGDLGAVIVEGSDYRCSHSST